MKKVLIVNAFILTSFTALSQDQIKGFWLAGEGKTIIEIYSDETSHYHGKIVWLEQPNNKKGEPHTDKMNQNKSLRDRPILGINMLEDLTYEDGKWVGTLYVPRRGRTVDVVLNTKQNNELVINVSFRGITGKKTWYRTELPE